MSVQQSIESKIADAIECRHLEVVNESKMHNVPPGSESHFKVVVVSEGFDDVRMLQRHRTINKLLADEFDQGLHALAIHAFTEAEWRTRSGDAPMSPPCRGGNGK